MPSEKPLVLVLGATGRTGQSIIQGLIECRNFRIAALIRPDSLSKPQTQELRSSGVEIRTGDITDAPEKLKAALEGVNILISAVVAWILNAQKEVFRVAKDVGVERIVPCDWATPGAKGVRILHDIKLGIRDYVKDIGVGYTFIDVGWWMQLYLPLPLRTVTSPSILEGTYTVYGTGDVPLLMTDLEHIGSYVARIIADPRTLNQAVIIWEDEVSRNKAQEIGQRVSGDGDALKAKITTVSAEDLLKTITEGRSAFAKNLADNNVQLQLAWAEYMYSMHVLGENTLENAKRLGYLDVQELYPEFPKHTLGEFAVTYYRSERPAKAYEYQ